MNKIKVFYKKYKSIIWIFILAYLLRVIGFTHGYPYVLSIDEPTMVRTTLGLFYTPAIEHFDWPHFSYYIHYLFYFIFIKIRGIIQILGLQNSLQSVFPIIWDDPFVFYTISRKISALLGALAVIPAYALGKRMFNKKMGLISALFITIAPYLIYSSHLTMQDGSIVLWVMGGAYFSYLASKDLNIKYAIWAAIMFALGASVKYHVVLMALLLPLFVLSERVVNRSINLKSWITKSLLLFATSFLVFLLTFLLANHRIVIDWDIFWSYDYGRGFLWQLNENSAAVKLSEYPSNLLSRTIYIFRSLGIVIPVLAVSSIYLIYKNKADRFKIIPIIIIIIVFILFTSRYERSGPRYFIPIFGLVSLLASYSYTTILDIWIKKDKYKTVFKLLVFVPLVIYAIVISMRFVIVDTRREALNYHIRALDNNYQSFYVGDSFSEINHVNNLHIKKYMNPDNSPQSRDILLSELNLESDAKLDLIEIIESKFYRSGPDVYVYEINIK